MTLLAGNVDTAGYTLLELLLVLTIIAGVLALAPPIFSQAVTANEPRTATRQIVAALRYARSEAVAARHPVGFTLDVEQHRYRLDNHPAVELPQSLELTLVVADHEVKKGSGAIRFFADGSATGGSIRLGNTAATYEVHVAWLTGQVTVLE